MVRFGAQLAAISASSGEARRSQLVHLDYTRLKGLLSEKEDSSFLLYLKREILRIDRCFDIELQIWLEEIIFQIPPMEAFTLFMKFGACVPGPINGQFWTLFALQTAQKNPSGF